MALASNFAVTQERLKEVLHYDPETGLFTWLRSNGRAGAGNAAGTVKKGRHTRLMIEGVPYYAHRLAFLYMTGRWPVPEADHIDLDKNNNKWSNLREASRSQNMANTRIGSRNSSGLKGITLVKRQKKWMAQITHNYDTIYLGCFSTKEEAHAAYCEASKILRGEFARAA